MPAEQGIPGISDEAIWQRQILADTKVHGAEAVLKAMVETANHTAERGYTKEALATLQWHKLAAWALPRALSVDPEELRFIDGTYFRSWVCELDGVKIDGHVYTDSQGSCTICGF